MPRTILNSQLSLAPDTRLLDRDRSVGISASLRQASNDDLKQAYRSRFRAKTGDTLNNSQAVADHLSTFFNGHTIEPFL